MQQLYSNYRLLFNCPIGDCWCENYYSLSPSQQCQNSERIKVP